MVQRLQEVDGVFLSHCNLSFTAYTIDINETLINKDTNISFPKSDCTDNLTSFCVIKILPSYNMNLNITIINMIFTGPSTIEDSCLFGGVSLYFAWYNGKTEEVTIYCENIDQQQNDYMDSTTFPSLLTNSRVKNVWISVASYRPYSSIQVKLFVSLTTCHGFIPIKRNSFKYLSNMTRQGEPHDVTMEIGHTR